MDGERFRKLLVWLLAITMYLNFGWVFSEYFDSHIGCGYDRDGSMIEKVLSGPTFMSMYGTCKENQRLTNKNPGMTTLHLLISILWPVLPLIAAVGWILSGLSYIIWLIFAGGIVKLFGPGVFYLIVLFSILVICSAWFYKWLNDDTTS